MTDGITLGGLENLSIQSLLSNYADIKGLHDAGKITFLDLMEEQRVVVEEIERRISEK